MAHVAKYKAPSVGHMLAHYTRSKEAVLERSNIDETRTHLNYVVGHKVVDGKDKVGRVQGQASWETVRKRMERVQDATGRKIRKDAVVMADMVVTAPKNVPEKDLQHFFNLSYIYLSHQVGRENMMGGYVHMDETTPHMHVPFTPIKDGKFNYKGLCPRSFYQQFHKGLGDFLESKMGYRPEIELSEERKEEKVLSGVPQSELDTARSAVLGQLEAERARMRDEMEREAAELEAVKKELAAKAEQASAIQGRIYDLEDKQVAEQDRLESLQRRSVEVAGRVEELQSIAADARAFGDASRSGKGAILDSIASRCDSIRSGVDERVSQLREAVGRIRGRISNVRYQIRDMRGLNVPAPRQHRQQSVAESLEHARQAAQAYNRSASQIARGFGGRR